MNINTTITDLMSIARAIMKKLSVITVVITVTTTIAIIVVVIMITAMTEVKALFTEDLYLEFVIIEVGIEGNLLVPLPFKPLSYFGKKDEANIRYFPKLLYLIFPLIVKSHRLTLVPIWAMKPFLFYLLHLFLNQIKILVAITKDWKKLVIRLI